MLTLFMPFAAQESGLVEAAETLLRTSIQLFFAPWINNNEEIFVHHEESVRMDLCKDHAHLSHEHMDIVLRALGVENPGKDSWKQFIRNELAILGQYALEVSVYIRNGNSLERLTVIGGPRPEGSQAEVHPAKHLEIAGFLPDRKRMSGDLEGAPLAKVVAVQIGRGDIIYLEEPFEIAMISAALHAHVANKRLDGEILAIRFGKKVIQMPAKYSPLEQGVGIIVHPDLEDFSILQGHLDDAREAEEDASFKLALGPLF